MHRLLDFTHDESHDVANRVAMQIHRSVDEHFPDTTNQSPRFSKTVFGGEDTAQNQVRAAEEKAADDQQHIPTKPRVQKLESAKKAEAPRPQPRSDVRDITPATEHGPGEFSDINTLTDIKTPEASLFKRLLMVLLIVSFLSAGIAYFVHKFLVS